MAANARAGSDGGHTVEEAAQMLAVSPRFLLGLLDRGEIPSTGVGASRTVTEEDLDDFRGRSAAKRAAALDELARNDADLL